MSVNRIIAMSTQPPKYPAASPRAVPMAVEITVARIPTRREIRAA